MEIITTSAQQTKMIGAKLGFLCRDFLAQALIPKPLVLLLYGDLGSGKTTFIKGFAKALRIKEKNILSPTFIIYNQFKARDISLYHFDLYRIDSMEDLFKLGFSDILREKNAIILIEWADKMGDFDFKNLSVIKINFKHLKGNRRKIIIEGL